MTYRSAATATRQNAVEEMQTNWTKGTTQQTKAGARVWIGVLKKRSSLPV